MIKKEQFLTFVFFGAMVRADGTSCSKYPIK